MGVIGVSLADYYAFSLLELTLKISGYMLRLELENYHPARMVLTMVHNSVAKHNKSASSMWPLSIDEMYLSAKEKAYRSVTDRDKVLKWALN